MAVLGGCGSTQSLLHDTQRAAHADDASPTARLCGNGRIDADEACDVGVVWDEDCPEGWGMCWECAPGCRSWARVYVPSDNSHAVFGAHRDAQSDLVEPIPPCDEPGRRYVYDDKGRLTESENRTQTVEWTWNDDGTAASVRRTNAGWSKGEFEPVLPLTRREKPVLEPFEDGMRYVIEEEPIGRNPLYREGRYDAQERLIFERFNRRSWTWTHQDDAIERIEKPSNFIRWELGDGTVTRTTVVSGAIRVVTDFDYDDRGRIVRRRAVRTDHGEQRPPSVTTWTWGKFGLEERRKRRDGKTSVSRWIYDDVGLVLYAADDKYRTKKWYAYDRHGRITYAAWKNSVHQEPATRFTWDEDGRLLTHGYDRWLYDDDGFPLERQSIASSHRKSDYRCHERRFRDMPRRRFVEREPSQTPLWQQLSCHHAWPSDRRLQCHKIEDPLFADGPADPVVYWNRR